MSADWRTRGDHLVLAEQRDLLAEIADHEQAVRRLAADLERVRGYRDRTIREALAEGHSQAEIGRITGMTRARINQLRN